MHGNLWTQGKFMRVDFTNLCMIVLCVCVCVCTTTYVQVLGATMDGNSVNRRLIKCHDPSSDLVYKVKNPFANEEHFLPPHLIKTVRNCILSKYRNLWVCTCMDIICIKYLYQCCYRMMVHFLEPYQKVV